MSKKITKAIIPVAGFGTRLLPATKVQPKEMMILVDKPVVHYLVEEAIQSGIETILFVINPNKHPVGDYFTQDKNLEEMLQKSGKTALFEAIKDIHTQAEFFYVHQPTPRGSGDAILCGRQFFNNKPFAAFYADDVITNAKTPALKQLMKVYKEYEKSVCALINVEPDAVSQYGIIQGKSTKPKTYQIQQFIEKPSQKDAPSTLASIGRFILTPDIFKILKKTKLFKGELYLASALNTLAQSGGLYGYEIDGVWHDCGSKIGIWKANVQLGLQDPHIKNQAQEFLAQLIVSKLNNE